MFTAWSHTQNDLVMNCFSTEKPYTNTFCLGSNKQQLSDAEEINTRRFSAQHPVSVLLHTRTKNFPQICQHDNWKHHRLKMTLRIKVCTGIEVYRGNTLKWCLSCLPAVSSWTKDLERSVLNMSAIKQVFKHHCQNIFTHAAVSCLQQHTLHTNVFPSFLLCDH